MQTSQTFDTGYPTGIESPSPGELFSREKSGAENQDRMAFE
jgi:hypothetical protein